MHNGSESFFALQSFSKKTLKPFALDFDPRKPNALAVLDDFSIKSFASVLNLWLVSPDRGWLDLDKIPIDFLLVESAWSGNFGRWKYMVTSSSGPKPPLVKLIQECKKRGIPTVFWNKEDPPHFKEFSMTARLFDYIYTSDSAMIEKYEEIAPESHVDMLAFAASPNLHNPSRSNSKPLKDVAFAGQFFAHKFPERRKQMEILFPAAAEYDFEIYSRALGGDPRYQFPQPYSDKVVGSLPYEKMVRTYNDYKVFLNVNSVVDSQTMCARRVFELAACKTAVFGLESDAIRSVFSADEVLLAHDETDVREKLKMLVEDDEYRERLCQSAWRKVLSGHTYEHRVNKILRALGKESRSDLVTLVVTSVREEFPLSKRWLDQFIGAQIITRTGNIEWVADCEKLDNPTGDVFWLALDPGVEYGPLYVFDLILALSQQDCDVVAKGQDGKKEQYVDFWPNRGWLAKYRVLSESSETGNQRQWPNDLRKLKIYLSDDFEVNGKNLSLKGDGNI